MVTTEFYVLVWQRHLWLPYNHVQRKRSIIKPRDFKISVQSNHNMNLVRRCDLVDIFNRGTVYKDLSVEKKFCRIPCLVALAWH